MTSHRVLLRENDDRALLRPAESFRLTLAKFVHEDVALDHGECAVDDALVNRLQLRVGGVSGGGDGDRFATRPDHRR